MAGAIRLVPNPRDFYVLPAASTSRGQSATSAITPPYHRCSTEAPSRPSPSFCTTAQAASMARRRKLLFPSPDLWLWPPSRPVCSGSWPHSGESFLVGTSGSIQTRALALRHPCGVTSTMRDFLKDGRREAALKGCLVRRHVPGAAPFPGPEPLFRRLHPIRRLGAAL